MAILDLVLCCSKDRICAVVSGGNIADARVLS